MSRTQNMMSLTCLFTDNVFNMTKVFAVGCSNNSSTLVVTLFIAIISSVC